MPTIANKSDFNLLAADELINKGWYAPSVHCSYYGCFQKMKSILLQRLSIPYEKILSEIKSSRFKKSEHTYVRDQIITDLCKKKMDVYKVRNLEANIKRLYGFRIESDYSGKEILYNTANEAICISKDVIKLLKSTYSV
jgi:uncharacterized protein (UPF0332 family)